MRADLQISYHELDPSSAPQRISKSSQFPEVKLEQNYPISDEYPSAVSYEDGSKSLQSVKQPPLTRRRSFSCAIAVLILVVAVAVAAAVGWYFGHHAANRSKSDSNFSPSSNKPSEPNIEGADASGSTVTTFTGNPSDALSGTSFASISYDPTGKYDGDTQQQTYVLFYQHSNGDIRKITYNESQWQPSEFVTSDARMFTGLSAVWFGNPPILIYLYYIDKSGVLQELRGGHASNAWSNGTLGAAGFRATNTFSALSAQFQGRCGDRGQLGWVFYESSSGVQEARWHYDNDTWVYGNLFRNLQPGSSFTTTIADSAINAWRFFGINKDLNVQEYACVECCQNSTGIWGTGLSISTTSPSTLGLTASVVRGPRLIYYQDETLTVRELNNTDFPSEEGPTEGWVTNARSDANKGINLGENAFPARCLPPNETFSKSITNTTTTTTITDSSNHRKNTDNNSRSKRTNENNNNNNNSTTPAGLPVVQAMRGSHITTSVGFRGKTNQIFLFYQLNGTDVRLVTRNENSIGGWGPSVALDLGIC